LVVRRVLIPGIEKTEEVRMKKFFMDLKKSK
jgi:hypothetical protein